MIALLLVTLSCQTADPCAQMCSTATQHYGGCLEVWGADWVDAGYADAHEFFHSCETWAWATRQLEAEAGAKGWTSDTCRTWGAAMSHQDFSCDEWGDFDWNGHPW